MNPNKPTELIEILQDMAESFDTIALSLEELNDKFRRIIDQKDSLIIDKPENRKYPEENK